MPKYSIVVPVYNGSKYLPECVESILAQTEADFELILVDDCSSDNSRDVIAELEQKDTRIKSVLLESNSGTLMARKAGVAATTGAYVMLVDQDDGLAPECLAKLSELVAQQPADIYHFGVEITAENAAAEDAKQGMLSYLTPTACTLEGQDILAAQFAEKDGFDWNVHHKLFAGELARKAWAAAADERLTLSDDLYACFIVDALASAYVGLSDAPWYTYNLGRGETFGESIDLDAFKKVCDRDFKAYELVSAYAASAEAPKRDDWEARLNDVCDRLIEHAMNEATDKLPEDLHEQAFRYAYEVWPHDTVAGELFRFVRDGVYPLVAVRKGAGEDGAAGAADESADATDVSATATGEPSAKLTALINLTAELDKPLRGQGSPRYAHLRREALSHMYDAQLPTAAFYAPLKLFVTTHKDVDLPVNAHDYYPVQVGPKKTRFAWATQDDTGENIADKNPQYCELTTQYWAWKNSDADYYGFCHYRRYFVFKDDEKFEENPWGEIIDDYIDEGTCWKYRLGDEDAEIAIKGYDIVTTGINDLEAFPEHYKNPRDHYARAPYLHIEDFDRAIKILKELHPDYAEDADAYLASPKMCFCNMYIMRKELFFAYCEWMFPVLEKFVESWDTTRLSHEALRTPGHLSERLFNIWLRHQKRLNPELKHKQLQCVHFEHPERRQDEQLAPATPANALASAAATADGSTVAAPASGAAKQTVPVVFAADNNYVPMVTTTVYSMLKNASPDYFYDVVILEKDFTAYNKKLMLEFFAQFENASLRFLNVAGTVASYHLQTNNEHISVETYYRFLIQHVLPGYNKVLYLDSDLIIKGDVSELYATELGDNLIAAARDIDYLGNLNMNDGIRMKYTKEVLKLAEPYDYFQAGVLVLNTATMRKLHTTAEWLQIASDSEFIYDDQDILNAECQGRVVYLDNAWNVMNDCGGRIKNVFSFAPAEVYDKFLAAYADSKIIHYAGFEKPWDTYTCDRADEYWAYARETLFYEKLLAVFCSGEPIKRSNEVKPPKAVAPDNPIRKVIDPLMPYGTKRREVAKSIGRKLKGLE